MSQRILIIVLILVGLAAMCAAFSPELMTDFRRLVSSADSLNSAKPIYRWVDKTGQAHYDSEVPQGVHAERVVDTNGSVNVLPATKPLPPPKPDESVSDPRSIGARAMDRAIDRSTK